MHLSHSLICWSLSIWNNLFQSSVVFFFFSFKQTRIIFFKEMEISYESVEFRTIQYCHHLILVPLLLSQKTSLLKGLLREEFGSFQSARPPSLTTFSSSPMPYTNFPLGASVHWRGSIILKWVFLELFIHARYSHESQNFYLLGN